MALQNQRDSINLYLYKKISITLYKSYLKTLCYNLKNIGININTVPVLDVLRGYTNNIIGKRSFSDNEKIVKCAKNGNEVWETLEEDDVKEAYPFEKEYKDCAF